MNKRKFANLSVVLGIMLLTLSVQNKSTMLKGKNNTTLHAVTSSNNTAYNLADKGIPVTVDAPAGAKIKKGILFSEVDGITYYNYDIVVGSFNLSVEMDDDDMWQTRAEYFADAKQYASEEDGFVKFELMEANGFIYKIDGEYGVDYGCYYLLIKNDRLIEFSVGLSMDEFTLEQVQLIYASAKTAR